MSKQKRTAKASSNGLNRREFVFATAAAAVVGTALSPAHLEAATPKRGGTARFGVNGASTNDSLDPGTFLAQYPYTCTRVLRNNLTEVAESGELIPELAQSWEPAKDLKSWTFRLRKGVQFHNGKSLTADDVVASLNHHRGKDSKSSARGYLTSVDDVVADGKETVVIRLNSANADIPMIMSDTRLPVMPADSAGKADVSGVGTGGYILERFEPGSRLTANRNPNYWKSGHAHFARVEIVAINDTTARSSALRSGGIDVMNKCDPKTVALLAKVPGIRVLELPTPQHFTAPMAVTMAPFDNLDVRLAVKHGINRQAIVDTALSGHGIVGNDHPIGPTYRYYAADIPQRPYDPDRAKFHLKKAGLDSLKVKLHTTTVDFPGANDAAVLMKEHARSSGIDVTVQQEPGDGYYKNVWKKVPWCMSASLGRPVESLMFGTGYVTGANSNEALWSNERFMSLFSEALGTVDESKRRDLYREMQMIIREDGGNIVYAFANLLDAHTSKIGHQEKVSNIGELDGFRASERWWFV